MPTFEVGFTWDGVPVGDDEIARFALVRDGLDWLLTVDAPYHGDPQPDAPAGPVPGLWEYEVVELFIVGLAKPGAPVPYTEIELGPGGHHLVLQLDGVRNPTKTELPLDFTATIRGNRWTGEARIPRRLLPSRPARMNAYAIHGQGDARRYLAMTPVPGPHPDFHRLAHFGPWVEPVY